ncbi:hypothetical protein EVG20_g9298 [Dentipellis fragilis]|uniref:Uncharacterized protein n=1 Tax=Dentipellis fragilis TaxID=205917 RepID=A0A4Y9Y0Q2_9AGAM|nr:hypothetical protein EVG20_g9298 [Dentipellis fragilis]
MVGLLAYNLLKGRIDMGEVHGVVARMDSGEAPGLAMKSESVAQRCLRLEPRNRYPWSACLKLALAPGK